MFLQYKDMKADKESIKFLDHPLALPFDLEFDLLKDELWACLLVRVNEEGSVCQRYQDIKVDISLTNSGICSARDSW